MDKFYVRNFKAFMNPISINMIEDDSDPSNIVARSVRKDHILLYGENGAGKTSLFEALKYSFFYHRMLKNATKSAVDQTQYNQLKREWLAKYLCKLSSDPTFDVKLDGQICDDTLNISKYQVFMLANYDMPVVDTLSIKEILRNIYFTEFQVDDFLNRYKDFLIENVNDVLERNFMESIRISLDQTDEYNVCIKDDGRNIPDESMQLTRYYNEAKLKLVSLLILFTTAELVIKPDSNIDKLLILDDVINSLDAANRGLLIKYIFEHFPDDTVHKIVMTHNVSFYNLWMYYVNEFEKKTSARWLFTNLYIKGNVVCLYEHVTDTVKKLKALYQTNSNDPGLGNRMRQHFEYLLFELTKILQVGAFNESGKLIDDLSRNKRLYIHVPDSGKPKDIYDMVDEVKKVAKYTRYDKARRELRMILDKYNDSNEYNNLIKIVDDMKLYQKIALHQTSHGHLGANTVYDKEIRATLDLLDKLEKAVDLNKARNVYSV